MSKYGQVSIFMVVGIIVVIAFTIVIISSVLLLNNPHDFTQVEQQLHLCMHNEIEKAILLHGLNGGGPPPTNIPRFAWTPDNTQWISEQEFTQSLEEYIVALVPDCVKQYGSIILEEKGTPQADTVMDMDELTILLTYPIQAETRAQTRLLTDHAFTFEVRLGYIYDIVNNLMQKKESHQNMLVEPTVDTHIWYDVSVFPSYQKYTLIDFNSFLFNEPYIFIMNIEQTWTGGDATYQTPELFAGLPQP